MYCMYRLEYMFQCTLGYNDFNNLVMQTLDGCLINDIWGHRESVCSVLPVQSLLFLSRTGSNAKCIFRAKYVYQCISL
jgi:hypothetical protein